MRESYCRTLPALLSLILYTLAGAANSNAQNMESPSRQQVISANPFGLLLNVFNAEYERVIGATTTAGAGGSSYFAGSEPYVNSDVFLRLYPQGNPLDGWAFGVKAGLTHVGDEGTYFGAGFDVNHSWVMGKNENFYAGIGFGLKRIYASSDADFDLRYVPTFRIINVGIVF
jgi:hypothetical protein